MGCEFLLTLAAVLLMGGAGALAAGPGDDVKSLINEVLGILNNPALQGTDHRPRKVDLVEKAAARISITGKWPNAAWGNLGTLNQGQQDEFVKNFSGLLKASFACRLDEFTKAGVNYQPEILQADRAEVPIIILRPNRQDSRELSDAQGAPGLDDL